METALGLAASVTVVVALILALAVGKAQGTLCGAVGQAGRAHAVGKDPTAVASKAYGAPVSVAVVSEGDMFTVTGSVPALKLGSWSSPAITCRVSGMEELSGQLDVGGAGGG